MSIAVPEPEKVSVVVPSITLNEPEAKAPEAAPAAPAPEAVPAAPAPEAKPAEVTAPEPSYFAARQAEIKSLAAAKGKGLQEVYRYFSDTMPIFSPIDENVSARLVDYLLASNLVDPEKEITLIINSPGGYSTDGFAVIDAMEYVSNPIRTVGLGQVSSMGLLIFMAGDSRVIGPNASVLSHRFWGGVYGSQAEIEAQQVELANVHARIVAHYAKYSKYSDPDEIETFLLREVDTFLTAKQAVKFKLADEILSPDFQFVEPMEMVEGAEGKAKTPAAEGKSLDTPPAPVTELADLARSMDQFSARISEAVNGPMARPEFRTAIEGAIESMNLALESLEALEDAGKAKPAPACSCGKDHPAAPAPAPEAAAPAPEAVKPAAPAPETVTIRADDTPRLNIAPEAIEAAIGRVDIAGIVQRMTGTAIKTAIDKARGKVTIKR